MIGDNVELVVLGVQGDQVRLGINAPRSVAVHRKEIFEQIQAENREAVSSVNLSAVKGFGKKERGQTNARNQPDNT